MYVNVYVPKSGGSVVPKSDVYKCSDPRFRLSATDTSKDMRDLPSEILTTCRKTCQCRSLYYTKGPLSWTGVIIRRRRKEGEIEGGKEIKGSGWMEGWLGLGWDGAPTL